MGREPLFTSAFLLCFAANFNQCLAFNLFLHIPGFLNGLGASEVEIGLIFGLTSLVAIGARPPLGPFMDLRGRRSAILLGGALNTLVCAGYLTVSDMGAWIYVLRGFHGVAEALVFTSFFTYAADLVPASRRTEGLALFGVSGMLPMGVSGVLGDVLLRVAGFDELFLTACALAASSLLLSLPLRDRPRDSSASVERGGFWHAMGRSDLRPLWWIGAVFALALASAFAFVKRFVDETGVGSVGGFFAAYSAAALVLRIFFAWLPDRVGPKRVLVPALACLAVGFLALAGAADARDVVIAGLLCGVGHGFTFPIVFSMVVTRAPEGDRGSATAIFTALFDVGMVLGGPLFGGLAGSLGFTWTYAVAAAIMAIGSVVFVIWDRGR